MKSKKIKEMEELIEIKTLKEKHKNELDQFQDQFIEEKAQLLSLKKQISVEKNKEHLYKNKIEKTYKFDIQYQKPFEEPNLNPIDVQYQTPLDGHYQKHMNGRFQEQKSKQAIFQEKYQDKRFSPNQSIELYQDLRNAKYHNFVPQCTVEKKPEHSRYNPVPDIQDYQQFFNIQQAQVQTTNDRDQRRRSLDIVPCLKHTQNYMLDRENIMRNEMFKQQNTYKRNMSKADNQITKNQTKPNSHIHYMPDYSNEIPGMNLNWSAPKRSHSIHTSNPVVGQFHNERAKSKERLVDALCEGCGKMANFLCSACKGVHYCTAQCQVEQRVGWLYNEKIYD